MSYRRPTYDTQQGVSRTRDATVPRADKLPTFRQDPRRREAYDPDAGTHSLSQSPPVKGEYSVSPAGRNYEERTAPLRSTTKGQTQRSTVSSKNPPAPAKRSTAMSASLSQEVPLLMEIKSGARTNSRLPSRALEPQRGTQSSLDTDHDAIFGIVMPRSNASARAVDLPPRLIPELQALAASSRPDGFNNSASSISSPSTRFSSYTSPWGASTTTTTPTSWSSASPSIVQQVPSTMSRKRSQTTTAPIARREKPPKMPALPESLPRSEDSEWSGRSREKTKSPARRKTPLSTTAPTPPPRTSSAKHSLSRSSSKSDRHRIRSETGTASTSFDQERSPLARRGQMDMENVGDSLQHGMLARAHDSLQQSLGNQAHQRRPLPSSDGETNYLTLDNRRLHSTGRVQDSLNAAAAGLDHFTDTETQPDDPFSVKGRPITPGDPGTDSPARPGKFSRLGLFGRRGKSPAAEVERSPRKLQRRGPAAGTGHEGYGKYAKRGRKMSQESSSAKNAESERSVSSTRRVPLFGSKGKESRSSSRHNRSSQSDLDDFAATRMKPVPIIGGSGSSLKSNSGSQLGVSDSILPLHSQSLDRWATPSQYQTSIERPSLQELTASSKEERTRPGNVPVLALRRSQLGEHEWETFNLPTPIRTHDLSVPTFINSRDESRSSAMAGSMSTASTTTDPNRSDSTSQRPKDKKTRKLRWNIFRRKDAEPEPEHLRPPSSSPEEMSVSISSVPVPRPMPYYAMMDSESEVYPIDQEGDYLSQVVQSPATSPFMGGYEAESAEEERSKPSYDNEVLLPSAALSPGQTFSRSPPSVPLQSHDEQAKISPHAAPQKHPRLVRVGRIPPVGLRSEREHKPSRASFSQPFARNSAPENPSEVLSIASPEESIPLQISTDTLPSRSYASADSVKPTSSPESRELEFLRFPSRQASETSASSSSDGFLSILAPALAPDHLQGANSGRALLQPDVYVPISPSADEIWNEYDDFIDQVMSPSRSRKSAKAIELQDLPTQLPADETPHSRSDQSAELEQHDVVLSDFPIPGMQRPLLGQTPATSTTPPVIFPPPTMSGRHVGEEIRLRRSRIVSALHSSMDPSSPFSIRDLLSEYDGHQRHSAKSSEHLSTSTAARSLEHLTAIVSAPEPQTETNRQENAALLDVVERSKDPAAQSERHYASLMVAKWLSFGRVLFSPAHDEIQSVPERHILVIDGLGNEDWSIYCAVTYEAQRAFVHDLKEKASVKPSKSSRPSQHAPENHRRAEVASFYERFPFPPSFFSVVVVRFPPAMAEAKMKHIIAECRRILLPGGHLELMLLDLDIVNMGVQTRRAVRELKMRMTAADKQLSLMPIIDNIQNVVGARGFTNISRCVVGVPVAGRPAGSTDSSSSSRSSGGSDGDPKSGSGETRQANVSPRMAFGNGRRGANLSLNDLVADHSDNADSRISKIVSRTARTWWQHCFEASVIDDGNLGRSIFASRTVLAECKARGSSFKMLIAFAQRPVFEPRRRTMSEPAVSTLATAGGQRPLQSSSSGSSTASLA